LLAFMPACWPSQLLAAESCFPCGVAPPPVQGTPPQAAPNTTAADAGLGGLLGGLGGLLGGGGQAASGGGIGGALGDLMDSFSGSGHGDTVKSWVETGPNRGVT